MVTFLRSEWAKNKLSKMACNKALYSMSHLAYNDFVPQEQNYVSVDALPSTAFLLKYHIMDHEVKTNNKVKCQ